MNYLKIPKSKKRVMKNNRKKKPKSFGLTIREISEIVGGKLSGAGETRVFGIGPVDEAGENEIACLSK